MARPLKLEVHESADYLLKSLRQARSAAQAERLRLLWWYKTGQVTEHKGFSDRLGRSPSTITRWLKLYRDEGLAGLLEERTAPGKPPRIDGDLLERLKARLDSPEGFASYGAVQQWLEAQSGETIPYKTVHKTVRYRLGAKLKAPRPQNINQDPEAVETYKKK
jgi:transposase